MVITWRRSVQTRTRDSILLGTVLWSGCVSTHDGVPLPATTPFERSSEEEAEYLRLFQAGYVSGRRGVQTTYCLFGADFENRVLVARSLGWTDGQAKGYLLWAAELDQALAERDRGRLLVLFESLGDEASAVVDDLLADKIRRPP